MNKKQGKNLVKNMAIGALKEVKDLPIAKQGISIFLEPLMKARQEEQEARLAEFLHRTFNGEPSEADRERLEKEGHTKVFTQFFEMVVSDSDSIKVKIYAEACKAVMDERVDITYRADFINAIRELHFKDFDFLMAIIEGIRVTPVHLREIFKNDSEKQHLERAWESTKNYLRAHSSEPHIPSINRLSNVGALSLPTDNMPSKPSNLGYAIHRALQEVVAETVNDVLDAFWEGNKHKPYQSFNPYEKKFEMMTPPSEGWTREQLSHRARPGMEGLIPTITRAPVTSI